MEDALGELPISAYGELVIRVLILVVMMLSEPQMLI